MPRLNEKQWHIWRATADARPGASLEVVSSGPQQARKVAAAFWALTYADVAATCVSYALPAFEGHGPRLAPSTLVRRYQRVEPTKTQRLLARREKGVDKSAEGAHAV
jgi:hypothetical protein